MNVRFVGIGLSYREGSEQSGMKTLTASNACCGFESHHLRYRKIDLADVAQW